MGILEAFYPILKQHYWFIINAWALVEICRWFFATPWWKRSWLGNKFASHLPQGPFKAGGRLIPAWVSKMLGIRTLIMVALILWLVISLVTGMDSFNPFLVLVAFAGFLLWSRKSTVPRPVLSPSKKAGSSFMKLFLRMPLYYAFAYFVYQWFLSSR